MFKPVVKFNKPITFKSFKPITKFQLSRSFVSAARDFSRVGRYNAASLVNAYVHSPDIYFLDVRPLADRNKFSVSGTLPFPLESIREKAQKLDKSQRVVIHCDSGYHPVAEDIDDTTPETEITSSLKAAKILLDMGFVDVNVVEATPTELVDAGFLYYSPETRITPPPFTQPQVEVPPIGQEPAKYRRAA
mmetsp:Transcript_10585/g.14494  ORF Transcript_10585/g.14494 Transcript_10585/m.14494 type:complete len:190 (+) Transcript_10585:118-687(+)